jgi:hypothetical protein
MSRSTISKSAPGFGTSDTFTLPLRLSAHLFWIYNRKLDAQPTKSDIFSAAELADRSKTLCARKSKSFAEISEAMHRQAD